MSANTSLKLLSSAAMALCLSAAPALAGDGVFDAKSDGDWMVRLRGIAVVPDESSSLSVAGLEADADTAVVPELDITYFFTENFAAELILATTKHDMKVTGPINNSLGSVWLLPPTLTAQYHFTGLGEFKPYLGAGVNYTIFYNEKPGAFNSVEYDNAFGIALQAGLDYEVAPGYYLNADVKKIFLNTDVKVNGGAVYGDVDLDPWIFGVGAGYRF